MYFFLVFFYRQIKIRKRNCKSHFLSRIFLFSQIAYILLIKGGFVKNGVNTPKNVEKHVIYDFFSEKKCIVAIFSGFYLLFDENNEISRKSSKN